MGYGMLTIVTYNEKKHTHKGKLYMELGHTAIQAFIIFYSNCDKVSVAKQRGGG